VAKSGLGLEAEHVILALDLLLVAEDLFLEKLGTFLLLIYSGVVLDSDHLCFTIEILESASVLLKSVE
jgi:hypothetical protein